MGIHERPTVYSSDKKSKSLIHKERQAKIEKGTESKRSLEGMGSI